MLETEPKVTIPVPTIPPYPGTAQIMRLFQNVLDFPQIQGGGLNFMNRLLLLLLLLLLFSIFPRSWAPLPVTKDKLLLSVHDNLCAVKYGELQPMWFMGRGVGGILHHYIILSRGPGHCKKNLSNSD